MSQDNKLPTNQQIAQYLDQEAPLQQLDNELLSGEPTFIHAQLAYAKSKRSKQTEQKKKAYKKKWLKKKGGK